MKDSQDWLDEILQAVYRKGHKDGSKTTSDGSSGFMVYTTGNQEAKSAIRKHILQEALEMIGEDESDDNVVINDLYMATRNGLRQELRNKFNDRYGE